MIVLFKKLFTLFDLSKDVELRFLLLSQVEDLYYPLQARYLLKIWTSTLALVQISLTMLG